MNKTMKILIGVLLVCVVGIVTYFYSPAYEEQKREKEKYRYWNELVAKNPKPENVSEEEFIAKNKAGYCWRDKKYYSAEELKHKAMVSLTERMLTVVDLFKQDKAMNTVQLEVHAETAANCKRFKNSCGVWVSSENYNNDELKSFLVQNIPKIKSEMEDNLYEILSDKLKMKEINSSDEFNDYLNRKDYGDFLLFQNDFSLNAVFGKNCCSILTGEQLNNTVLGFKALIMQDVLSLSHSVPLGFEITDYIVGDDYTVGNYYLLTEYFDYSLVPKYVYENNKQIKYTKVEFEDVKEIYFLNNCGDVLSIPYYGIYSRFNNSLK